MHFPTKETVLLLNFRYRQQRFHPGRGDKRVREQRELEVRLAYRTQRENFPGLLPALSRDPWQEMVVSLVFLCHQLTLRYPRDEMLAHALTGLEAQLQRPTRREFHFPYLVQHDAQTAATAERGPRQQNYQYRRPSGYQRTLAKRARVQ